MRGRPSRAVCLLCAAALTAVVGLRAVASLLAAEAGPQVQIMPVSDVRAGMQGYGLTAFQGTAPEKFGVEVLGVLKGAFAKGDLVLVRMSGPVLDEAGIISGMSGSPVYVDGKLLGAVAYGWRYTKVPLAGITPAEDMMRVQEMDRRTAAGRRAAAKERAREAFLAGSRDVARLLTSGERGPAFSAQVRRGLLAMAVPPSLAAPDYEPQAYPPAVGRMLPQGVDPRIRPLPIPIAVAGMGTEAGSLLSLLPEGAFIPVQAAAPFAAPASALTAASAASADAKLEPGVPVGAALVTGDLDLSAVGTLTWTEGNRALAFGHPMFGSGETDIPLAIGEVQAIVPSLANSFKLTNIGKVVGRITEDREPAIMARLGEQAPTFPCKVRIRGAVNEEYNYRVAGYWTVAPLMATIAIAESSGRWEGSENRYTLKARAEISIEGRQKPLVLENVYTDSSTVPPALDLVMMPVENLLLNSYQELKIQSLNYDLEVTSGFEAALIRSAWADRVRARPGTDVTVYVRLRQYRGDESVKRLQVHIPETAKPGSEVTVLVCDAATQRMTKQSLDPGFFEPKDLESLVRALSEVEPNRNLFLRVSVLQNGLRYGGEAMPALPPSAMSVLEYAETGDQAQPLRTDYVTSVETPWVLEGAAQVSVFIEEPRPYSP